MIPACHAPCECIGIKALTGGGSAQRSTSTSAVAELGPWLNREVPRSRVSTLALPCAQGASSSSLAGSYQAPQDSRTTPGRTASRNEHAGETRASGIEYAHHLAIADAAVVGIDGVDRKRLSPRGLAERADRAAHPSGCAICTAAGSTRDAAGTGPPLLRPAIRPARSRPDAAGNRRSRTRRSRRNRARSARRACAACVYRGRRGTPQTARIPRPAAGFQPSPFPRTCRTRGRGCSARARGMRRRGARSQAISSRPSAKAVLAAEAPGEIAENVEVVASLADRLDRLMHRDDEPVARRAADIVAFERGGRRQHDVGVARRRRPPRLVHDDRFRALPGAAQPVQVLMVVERVAAGPIDQPDVGIGCALAVIIVALARDAAGSRRCAPPVSRAVPGWAAPALPGRRTGAAARPRPGARAIAKTEPAARQTDLAEARREQHQRPIGLLAMIGALQ